MGSILAETLSKQGLRVGAGRGREGGEPGKRERNRALEKERERERKKEEMGESAWEMGAIYS